MGMRPNSLDRQIHCGYWLVLLNTAWATAVNLKLLHCQIWIMQRKFTDGPTSNQELYPRMIPTEAKMQFSINIVRWTWDQNIKGLLSCDRTWFEAFSKVWALWVILGLCLEKSNNFGARIEQILRPSLI